MDEKELKKLVRDMSYLAEMFNKTLIKKIVSQMHPADLAQILHHLSKRNRDRIFNMLDLDTASDVISHLDEVVRDKIIEEMDTDRISEIVEEMESDDATDLLAHLPSETADQVLAKMDKEESEEVKELLKYEEDTAGGIMAKEIVYVEQNRRVDEAIREIRDKAEEVEEIYYVFVVDSNQVLVGGITLKKLLLSKHWTIVKDLMTPDILSVDTSLDQEEVANIVRKYDLVSLPVVDENDVLVGRITIDDVLDVFAEESSEDINHMAGISSEEPESSWETSSLKASRVRLPWLITGLVGGILGAVIISHFERALDEILTLAFFTPVVMAMGGGIGIQSSTIVVRGLATGEIGFFDVHKQVFKEMKVAFINGLVCSILLFAIVTVWKNVEMGMLLGSALFMITNIAGIIGTIVPLLLKKMNVDPAIATGPFITISNDIIALLIYLGIASLYMDQLTGKGL